MITEFYVTPERRKVIQQQLNRIRPILDSLLQQKQFHAAQVTYHQGLITRLNYELVAIREQAGSYGMELKLFDIEQKMKDIGTGLDSALATVDSIIKQQENTEEVRCGQGPLKEGD